MSKRRRKKPVKGRRGLPVQRSPGLAKGLRAKQIIDYLRIGEGPEKSTAFRFAQARQERSQTGKGRQHSIAALDYAKPMYAPPANIHFISTRAVQHLEHMQPNSVRVAGDEFFLQFTLGGSERGSQLADLKKTVKKLRKSTSINWDAVRDPRSKKVMGPETRVRTL